MFDCGYLAVGRRCAVRVADLELPLSEEEVLARLESKGFKRADVSLQYLSSFCRERADYERGARIELAPEAVDCSSLVKWLYGQRGIWIPRHSLHQRAFGQQVELSDLQPWDLVFVEGTRPYYLSNRQDGVGHVGIALNNGRILHAANSKDHVVETTVKDFLSGSEFRGVTRIIKPETVTLESFSGRRAECSLDYRCYIFQTLED